MFSGAAALLMPMSIIALAGSNRPESKYAERLRRFSDWVGLDFTFNGLDDERELLRQLEQKRAAGEDVPTPGAYYSMAKLVHDSR